jgi:hypothetical protein
MNHERPPRHCLHRAILIAIAFPRKGEDVILGELLPSRGDINHKTINFITGFL